jgi:mannonate dehydratase
MPFAAYYMDVVQGYQAKKEEYRMNDTFKISKSLGNLAEETLRFYRQIGVEEVAVPGRFNTRINLRPLVPPTQRQAPGPQPDPWEAEELHRIADHVRSFDLEPTTLNLPLSGNILMGRPGRDADLEKIGEAIRIAGAAGFRVLTYNFTALRASEGYATCHGAGRGGAHLRDFDHQRIRDLPPLPDVGVHTREEMWDRLEHFLKAIVPIAAAAGVRLAVHPNDPPVPEYRSVAQPLCDLESLKRLIEIVDNPANSLFFDTGVATEWGEDAVAAIRYFGGRDRIATVHFRNVRIDEPFYKYTETFIDQGECDMRACMRAFADVGYSGGIDPDHTPGITADSQESRIGWAFAIGHMIALRSAAYA